MTKADSKRLAIVLGIADGLTCAIGLIIGLHGHHSAIFAACLSAGIAELVGMAAGVWLSSPRSVGNFFAAMACGVGSALGCIAPAVPFLLGHTLPVFLVAGMIAILLGVVVAWLRPEKGWLALVETYGVLVLAAVLVFIASLI